MPKRSKQCCQNYCEELPEEVYYAGVVLYSALQQVISQGLISRELESIREQTFSEITSLRLVVTHEFLTSFLVGWNEKLLSIS